MEQEVITQEQNGTITFANEVIATIAGIAACDIPGVAGMSGGLKDGIVDFLGRKNFTKGIKVVEKDGIASIDAQIILDYGVLAPEVCANIQTSVKKAVETMTGLSVKAVNIAVQGIKFKELAVKAETETDSENN